MRLKTINNSLFKKIFSVFLIFCFVLSSSSTFGQPALYSINTQPAMLSLTDNFNPALIKGIEIYPDNPLKFDFIIERGDFDDEELSRLDKQLTAKEASVYLKEQFRIESEKLIKYFLTALTVPENEMWVNLSPYEKDRIVPQSLGTTDMGGHLLQQDFLLKKLSSSLMNPQDKPGQEFWDKIYSAAYEQFGTTDIPADMFYKIWIVPDKVNILEHSKGALISNCKLKVMLEDDYIAMRKSADLNANITKNTENNISDSLKAETVKKIFIPLIEKEVNYGKHFANLRQIYHATILAAWYKQTFKNSLINKIYSDKDKTKGIETTDKGSINQVYSQYTESFKNGVLNLIHEDYDPATQQIIPKKYFSGGYTAQGTQNSVEQGTQLADNNEIVSAKSKLLAPEVVTSSLNGLNYSIDNSSGNKEINSISAITVDGINSSTLDVKKLFETSFKLEKSDEAMAVKENALSILKERGGVDHKKTELLIARSWFHGNKVFKYYYFNPQTGNLETELKETISDEQSKVIRKLGETAGNTISEKLFEDLRMGMQIEITQANIKTRENYYLVVRTKDPITKKEITAYVKTAAIDKSKRKIDLTGTSRTPGITKEKFDQLVPLADVLKENRPAVLKPDLSNYKELLANEIYGEKIQHERSELLSMILHDKEKNAQYIYIYDEAKNITIEKYINPATGNERQETYHGNIIYETLFYKQNYIQEGKYLLNFHRMKLFSENYEFILEDHDSFVSFTGTPLFSHLPALAGNIKTNIKRLFDLVEVMNQKTLDLKNLWETLEISEQFSAETIDEWLTILEENDFSRELKLVDQLNLRLTFNHYRDFLSVPAETINDLKRKQLAIQTINIFINKRVLKQNIFTKTNRHKKLTATLINVIENLDIKNDISYEDIKEFLEVIEDFTLQGYNGDYFESSQVVAVNERGYDLIRKLKPLKQNMKMAVGDSAMAVQEKQQELKNHREVGGIDLASEYMDININKTDKGLIKYKSFEGPLHINIDGFMPVIISSVPLITPPLINE